ncbi:MAG: dTDP-4-dehydrorhamnose 3,5-epimerase [Candidatus Levybacteria bacterium]|nr:dTDP-4-dehydrorhamnose 3,5-epimerase [Candidatus Levybacteria bacterium]
MKFTETKIKGVYIIEPEPREDSRGYFARVFAKEELAKIGIDYSIVHINRSLSTEKGVIRGLHYQKEPHAEDKIVQCLGGKIFDVAVDIRKDSETYGQWVGEILDPSNKKMLLVPKGCAHGFQTLEENSVVEYFVTEYYKPESERGIKYNDAAFNIAWPITDAIVSEKDGNWPDFNK